MVKDVLHEPYELVLKEIFDECPRGEHSHSFFELVYIISGTGSHIIGGSSFDYKPGNLFLLAPNEMHDFKGNTPTQLFFIRFNHVYIKQGARQNNLLKHLETILNNSGKEFGCVLKNEADKPVAKSILTAIIAEHINHGLYHKELLSQYIDTLLVLVARNVMMGLPVKITEQSDDRAINILQYIQANIYEPDKLKGEHISREFGIAENYLGRYFRKHTNETLQQYVMNYKLKLVENRLLHTDMRMNEIADELGFTDKSHLNRLFKKYRGMNPSQYRKQPA